LVHFVCKQAVKERPAVAGRGCLETWRIGWTPMKKSGGQLGLRLAFTNGCVQFLDTNAPLFNQRFYLTLPQ
jgi:hypothetical protein